MEKHLLMQIILSSALVLFVGLFFRLYGALVAAPRRLRLSLKQQGIGGPPPAFLLGNILAIKNSRVSTAAAAAGLPASHNCGAYFFSVFDGWRRQYGDIYTFSLGNKPVLLVNKYDLVREVTTCTSLDLGKPSYQAKDFESLLGHGILTSNGSFWSQQRKILAPELFNDKVKGMIKVIQQSTLMLIDSWKDLIDAQSGKADVKIDDYLRKFSGEVISSACFGSNYAEGEELFQKLRALQQVNGKRGFFLGIPGMSYVPTKQNRRAWELQRDVKGLILKLIKQKNEANLEKNMLQMILEGAKNSNMSSDEIEKFTIDNCKNIYLAGYETTAIVATWCLMLLASNPEWQDRVRHEVIEVCQGRVPDSESIRHMKQLTMVINESMRLYPPVTVVSREALDELEFANIHIPKGVLVWIIVTALHTDPEIWGQDSYEFNPERFTNGTTGACKLPHLYMPFGVGPRMCLGLNLALVELKILVALILSNFSLTLSPKYVHSPALHLVLEPGNGVDLVIEKLKQPTTRSLELVLDVMAKLRSH